MTSELFYDYEYSGKGVKTLILNSFLDNKNKFQIRYFKSIGFKSDNREMLPQSHRGTKFFKMWNNYWSKYNWKKSNYSLISSSHFCWNFNILKFNFYKITK